MMMQGERTRNCLKQGRANLRTSRAAYLVVYETAIILQDIEDTSHLAKDEDTRSFFLKLFQQLVKKHHLSTVLPKMWAVSV
jgi:hypothetical protein